MKKLACLALALSLGAAREASADIKEFTVNLSPQLASLTYESASIAGIDFGCGPIANQCEFGLEASMSFQVDDTGNAQATVAKVELHGNEQAFDLYPGMKQALENDIATVIRIAAFNVVRDANDSTLTAEYAMSDDLVFEFSKARLMTISGGPDYRPVDGPRYTFSYAVPEPSSMALGVIATLGMFGGGVIRRFRRFA